MTSVNSKIDVNGLPKDAKHIKNIVLACGEFGRSDEE